MSAAAALDFTYLYPFASAVQQTEQALGLRLATCGATHEHPHFFDGCLRQPRVVGDMLLELLTDLGLALSPAARERLAPIKGSSKTAKCARSLVALKSSGLSAKMQRAQVQMLEARITRAERWASSAAEC